MVPNAPEKHRQEVYIAGSFWSRTGGQLFPITVRDGKDTRVGLQITPSLKLNFSDAEERLGRLRGEENAYLEPQNLF